MQFGAAEYEKCFQKMKLKLTKKKNQVASVLVSESGTVSVHDGHAVVSK